MRTGAPRTVRSFDGRPPGRRNVLLDSSVLISYIISKKDGSVAKKVVTKARDDDNLMITDVIRDEILGYASKDSGYTEEMLERGLEGIGAPIFYLGKIPPLDELKRRYYIRDDNDYKVLYSVDLTGSTIVVTYDDDFFDGKVSGVDAEFMDPVVYLYEGAIKSGEYVPKRPKNRRLFRARKGRWTHLLATSPIAITAAVVKREHVPPRHTDSGGSASRSPSLMLWTSRAGRRPRENSHVS